MKLLASGILMTTLLAAGCEEAPNQTGGVSPTTRPTAPIPMDSPYIHEETAAKDKTPETIYLTRLQLVTIEVPRGIASRSEELWSHLDEEPVSLQSRVLGMNGFRVGIGRKEDWDDIEKSLKRMTGQVFQSATIVIAPGRPAPLELQTDQPTRLLFTSREDQTLSGEHVPPGDYLLTILCTLNEDDPNKVLMTVVPQIRSSRRVPKLVHEHGVTTMVNEPVFLTLEPMAFQLTVKNNDFLVIGPGVLAQRPTSPGKAFLTKDRKGVSFETVILLRPMVHAVRMDPATEPKEP
ncbi:MAG: hypothetical protein JXA11_00160 [Phycisphaerae bacterium]|nr:hypothetical protein [Phycisphaerae bacterium]